MESARLEPAIRHALLRGEPVVALESALITHGFSHPANLRIAQRMESTIREEGANPATIAVIDGEARVGLAKDELLRLASPPRPGASPEDGLRKLSLRDLPIALAGGATGGTTVAATIHLAHHVGIDVMATGGIGGVHRGASRDVSADLTALGQIPITVVSSGAKAILDLHRTREILETKGIPVVGYGTSSFPAFYSRSSDLSVDVAVDAPEVVAALARAIRELHLSAALLVCVPVPREAALSVAQAEGAVARAVREAAAAEVKGKELTPFLLARVVELTAGESRRANEALLVNNARVAARIARAIAEGKRDA